MYVGEPFEAGGVHARCTKCAQQRCKRPCWQAASILLLLRHSRFDKEVGGMRSWVFGGSSSCSCKLFGSHGYGFQPPLHLNSFACILSACGAAAGTFMIERGVHRCACAHISCNAHACGALLCWNRAYAFAQRLLGSLYRHNLLSP